MNRNTRQCPKCNEVLVEELLVGQVVDRCESCGGRWLDESELGPIARGTSPPTNRVDGRSDAESDLEYSVRELLCPDCDRVLASLNYAHDSGVYLKKCESCGGVWVEPGQFELIARYRTGSLAVRELGLAMSEDLRIQGGTHPMRILLRSRVLSVVVAITLFVFYVTAIPNPFGRIGRRFGVVVLALIGIWYPDRIGSLPPMWLGRRRRLIHQETPGDMVALGSWLVMFSPLIGWLIWQLMS